MVSAHALDTPDGTLYYEVRGEGTALVLTGAPMAAGKFVPLANLLARDRMVVTHDPRGYLPQPSERPGTGLHAGAARRRRHRSP